MVSPFVYLPGERLSGAELSAARLDGDVVALGDAFIPADVVESTALRAATLTGLLGASLAATHLTAAWVHGGLDVAPARHTVQRAVARRLHHQIDRRFVYRDSAIAPDDLEKRGGVLVTTVGRTAADLARTPDDDYARVLAEWARRDRAVIQAAEAWLTARPRHPHTRRALTLLDALAAPPAQDDVTR